MTPVLILARFLMRTERKALWRGLVLSLAVLIAGIALLGLSGWFIVAAAAAGLAGTGQVFDVFRPSAGVRFLALGRTAARYGERILSHEATLRALARLRVQVFGHLSHASFGQMLRLRGADALNRLTSDIDALDGLTIRVILPLLAGSAALILSFAALWLLVDLRMAVWVIGALALASIAIFAGLARRSYGPTQRAEAAKQALRRDSIDHLRGRDVLGFAGVLEPRSEALAQRARALGQARREVAALEVRAGLWLALASGAISAGALALGGLLALNGAVTAAQAALGFFATLALFETVAPLRRGLAEIGGIVSASSRLAAQIAPLPEAPEPPPQGRTAGLCLDEVQVGFGNQAAIAPVSFAAAPGQTVALVGPSGVGKTTLLHVISGLMPALAGQIRCEGAVGYLLQRPALLRGTFREAVCMGHGASDAEVRAVLEASDLWQVVQAKGGLDAALGEAGAGLSGGQRKRLALARVLLRKPSVLLLDELSEGLDDGTARRVLTGLRAHLPEAVIVLAAHRPIELEAADQRICLNPV